MVLASCRCGSGPQVTAETPEPPGDGCLRGSEKVLGGWQAVDVDGKERSFILDVPASQAGERLPVVLSFHGIGADPASLREYTSVGEEAQGRGFIAVHPEGQFVRLGPRFGPGWSVDAQDNRDVRLVEQIVDWLEGRWCIDTGRVYVMGFSNGGHLTHVLGCKLSGKIAGIAAVGGALKNMAGSCGNGGHVPVMIVHGGADPVVGVQQGRAAAKFWKQKNGCGGAEDDGPCTVYDGCEEDVVFCEVDGLTHSWPRAQDGLDATGAILDFFGL